MTYFFKKINGNWREAYANRVFRLTLLTGLAISAVIIYTQPAFYRFLVARQGVVLNDILLSKILPYNVSVPVFIIIWGMILLGIRRCLTAPHIFLNYMLGFIVITFLRVICLSSIALDPPVGIMELKDPFTDLFYGGVFITKDLFFSGHTATLVLLSLALENQRDKRLCLLSAIVVAALLLVQHVHYTIDVIAAPIFAWVGYTIGQKVLAVIRTKQAEKSVPATAD